MKILVQPYSEPLGKLLEADLGSGRFHSFSLSAAYAKISGVDALFDALSAFKAAGGAVRATIGIDQRNTSFEALMAMRSLADELYLFHNRNLSSTFHPKLYVFSGEAHGKIYVGSNNLTDGGLYSNYEVAGWEEFDLTDPAEAQAFDAAVRSLRSFWEEGPCCRAVTEDLLRQLYADHLLCSEGEIRALNGAGKSADAALREKPYFGAEQIPGHGRKHDFRHLSPDIAVRPEYRGEEILAAEDDPGAEADGAPVKSFYKHLSRNDVDLKSSPGQIIIPIGFKSFFGPLSEPQTTKVGARQSERFFPVKYENTGEIVANARVIFYVPSPQAPRKNSELRFALRSRDIFGTFEQGDVLVFTQAPQDKLGQYLLTLRRIPRGSAEAAAYPERFGWVSE